MADDDGDKELRDAFGAQLTEALHLRSRDDAHAVSLLADRRPVYRRVLAAAAALAILAGTAALIADRTRHTERPTRPSEITTRPTDTAATNTSPTTEPSPPTTARPALAPVTADEVRDAPVGALCGHPAGRLQDGKLPGIAAGAGFVELRGNPYSAKFAPLPPDAKTVDFGDLNGDGVAEAVAIVGCSADGNDVDTQAFVWAPGPRLIGRVPFEGRGANTGAWPNRVSSVAIADGAIRLTGVGWQETDCHDCPSLSIARSVTMRTDGIFASDRTDRLGHNITMDGIGPVHAGTPFAALASVTNSPVEVSDPTGQNYPSDSSCVYFTIWGTDRIGGTGGNGEVGAIYVNEPEYRTERGVGPGSTVAEVERAYPGEITRRDNMYRAFDDLYAGSTGSSGAAIRFVLDQETGTHVDEVISGNQPAVSAAEGCS